MTRSVIRKTSLRLMPFYMTQYMVLSMYQSYFPVYLSSIGIGDELRGVLMALAPLVAMLGQPVWGNAGDRAGSKNRLLQLLCLAAAVLMLLMAVWTNVLYLALMFGAFAFFYMSIQPMGDAIAMESLKREGLPFGPVRASATVAFAVLSAVSGLFLTGHAERSVYASAVLLLAAGICVFLMPTVPGHRKEKSRGGMQEIFRYRHLLWMMGFSALMMVGMTFFYNGYSVYFTEDLGGSETALGICYFISAMTELPFLFGSRKLYEKFGIGPLLAFSAGIMGLRWLILGLTESWAAAMVSQLMHCGCFLFMSFAMIHFVDKVIPPEYKAAGQMFYTLFTLSAAKIIGSLVSGLISGAWGLDTMFLVGAGISFAAMLGVILYSLRHREVLQPVAKKEE
ncbi:MAG: MFS transporter [Oscillospiraceae bacterium]|nr:MFS transporter [Oscillospiraceae bacterium]